MLPTYDLQPNTDDLGSISESPLINTSIIYDDLFRICLDFARSIESVTDQALMNPQNICLTKMCPKPFKQI